MAIRDKRIISLDMLGDVEITEPALANQGLWYDAVSGVWTNGAAFEESWPTGLADGGELNILSLDIWTDPPTFVGPRWTDNGDGSYTGTGGAADNVGMDAASVDGVTYSISFTVESVTGPGFRVRIGTTNYGPTYEAPGEYSIDVLAEETGGIICLRHLVGEEGTVSGISVVDNSTTGIQATAGLAVISDAYTVPLAPPAVIGVRWDEINELITAAPAVAGSVVWLSIYNTGVPDDPPIRAGVEVFVGALRQYAQGPTPTLAKKEVFLGVAIHNGTEWKEVSNPKVINQAAETLREIATAVLPLSSIISGGSVTELPGFEVEQESGVIWEQNRNWHRDKSDPHREALPAASPVSFRYVNRDFTDVSLPMSEFNPDLWDDDGIVSAVPGSGNTATIQRLYIDPANNYWVAFGQFTYPNFFAAEANIATDLANSVVPLVLQSSILLGYAVMEKGKNDWDVNEAVFVPASGLGGLGGGGGTPITDHDNLSGITPDNHHNQVHLLDGEDHSDINQEVASEVGSSLVWTGRVPEQPFEFLNLFVAAMYGGIRQSTPVALANIGSDWVTLQADGGTVTTPRSVIQDTANNGLRVERAGVFLFNFTFSIAHNESNGSRETTLRVYNVDSDVDYGGVPLGIARNQPITSFSTSLQIEPDPTHLGDLFVVQVGDGDSLTGVTQNGYNLNINAISEYRG